MRKKTNHRCEAWEVIPFIVLLGACMAPGVPPEEQVGMETDDVCIPEKDAAREDCLHGVNGCDSADRQAQWATAQADYDRCMGARIIDNLPSLFQSLENAQSQFPDCIMGDWSSYDPAAWQSNAQRVGDALKCLMTGEEPAIEGLECFSYFDFWFCSGGAIQCATPLSIARAQYNSCPTGCGVQATVAYADCHFGCPPTSCNPSGYYPWVDCGKMYVADLVSGQCECGDNVFTINPLDGFNATLCDEYDRWKGSFADIPPRCECAEYASQSGHPASPTDTCAKIFDVILDENGTPNGRGELCVPVDRAGIPTLEAQEYLLSR